MLPCPLDLKKSQTRWRHINQYVSHDLINNQILINHSVPHIFYMRTATGNIAAVHTTFEYYPFLQSNRFTDWRILTYPKETTVHCQHLYIITFSFRFQVFFALVTLGINYYFVSKCLIIKLKHSSQRKKDTHQSVPFYSSYLSFTTDKLNAIHPFSPAFYWYYLKQ